MFNTTVFDNHYNQNIDEKKRSTTKLKRKEKKQSKYFTLVESGPNFFARSSYCAALTKKMLSIVYIAVINVYMTFIDFCYINAVVSAMNEILWIFIFLKYKE